MSDKIDYYLIFVKTTFLFCMHFGIQWGSCW